MSFDIVAFSAYFKVAMKYFYGVSLAVAFVLWMTGHLNRIVKNTYGFVEEGEQTKFSLLSLCFGLVLGVYWLLRTSKEAVFFDLAGNKFLLAKAKMITPFVTFALLFIFGMIVDKVRRHRLFWVAGGFYGTLFGIIAILMKLGVRSIEIASMPWIPAGILGWIYFLAVESLGGLIVGAVFWAFVASTTKTESAKRGYPLITLGGQIGYLTGPAIVAAFAVSFGMANLMLVASAILFLLPILMEFYMQVVPTHLHESDDSGHAKKKTGAWEGLRLLFTSPFLMGVAVVSTIYEAVNAIIDFQFKILGSIEYPVAEQLAAFTGLNAMAAALMSILLALGGTSFVLKRLGVKLSLLVYPCLLGIVITGLYFKPGLFSFFIAILVAKALAYAFNTPIKELLYLPTSKDVKMKAKGFIEGFGGKTMKGAGSLVNDQLGSNMSVLLNYGCLMSLGIIGLWIFVALAVGTKYNSLIEEKKIIE